MLDSGSYETQAWKGVDFQMTCMHNISSSFVHAVVHKLLVLNVQPQNLYKAIAKVEYLQ